MSGLLREATDVLLFLNVGILFKATYVSKNCVLFFVIDRSLILEFRAPAPPLMGDKYSFCMLELPERIKIDAFDVECMRSFGSSTGLPFLSVCR